MRKRAFSLVVLPFFLWCSCTSPTQPKVDPRLLVAYATDKDGIYVYRVSSGITQRVTSVNEVFFRDSLRFMDDSVLVAGYSDFYRREARKKTTGELLECPCSYTDSLIVQGIVGSDRYDRYTLCQRTFQAFDIGAKTTWKYLQINFELKEHTSMKRTTTYYNRSGDVVSSKDTFYECSGQSSRHDGVRFCETEGRFYVASNSVNGKYVFSQRGSLYLKDGESETLLLQYDGHFEPKFGSGYYNPTLSPDGNKVVFQYLAGFLHSGSGLFELDIKTGAKKLLSEDGYFDPKYSPDGAFLLLAKDHREGKEDRAWISDIYIFDLKTGNANKIGEGSLFTWN